MMSNLRKRLNRVNFQDVIPFVAFIVIFTFFAIMSYDDRTSTIRMLTRFNLTNLLDQSILVVVAGSGMIFVVAQGSIDLSVGVNLAISGVVATWVYHLTGLVWILIPTAMLVGLLVGAFNGFIVSRFKVPSFMLTIAMLIAMRGIVDFIQSHIGNQRIPESLRFLNDQSVKITIFIVVVLIMAYVFEFTKAGKYSKAIGENETAAKSVGIPVARMKLLAFALSGLMAGVAAVFSLVTFASTSQQMGVFLEMRTIMAIFLGGVLITGGSSAKSYKVILGSLSITMIINGLAMIGRPEPHISQAVQGLLLLLILIISVFAGKKTGRFKDVESLKPKEEDTKEETQ